MADKILTTFKQGVASLSLRPDSGGCFEVTVDDQLVYSKLQTGQFPEEEDVVKQLRSRVSV